MFFDIKKDFYKEEEFTKLFIRGIQSSVSTKSFSIETRFLVVKEMPDAKIGTVMWPVLNEMQDALAEDPSKGYHHFGYHSKYSGRRHFLHKEVLFGEEDWFVRIN